jgi:hypothetical protein
MKSRHLISLLCLFVLLCLVCCKHEPPPPVCQYDSAVSGMKEWYYFKTGSWWVYEEENTGVFDTITVYHHWDGLVGGTYEGFEWYGNSSLDGFNYKYRFNTSYTIYCLNTPECDCHKLARSRTMSGNFVGEGQIFLYPIILGNYTSNGGPCVVTGLWDNLLVGSVNYGKVMETDVAADDSEYGSRTKYKWAKNVGIIQFENLDLGTSWILKDYSVVQ